MLLAGILVAGGLLAVHLGHRRAAVVLAIIAVAIALAAPAVQAFGAIPRDPKNNVFAGAALMLGFAILVQWMLCRDVWRIKDEVKSLIETA